MRLSLITALALTLTAPALAEPCKTKGSPDAQMIATLPDPSDKAFYRALAAATQPATTAKAQAQKTCVRSGTSRGISGENTDAFPRVFRQGPRLGYLSPLPMLKDGKKTTVYAVVLVWGSGAVRVGGLIDAIPEDSKLRRFMVPGGNGGFDPLTFDERTGLLVDVNSYLAAELKQRAGMHNACLRDPACGAPADDETP